MKDRFEDKKPLSLREYLGVFKPEEPAKGSEHGPLTLREYMSISPLPNIDEVVAFAKWVGRGGKRLLGRIRHS